MNVTTSDQTTVKRTPVAWISTWLPMLSMPATPPKASAPNTPVRIAPKMPLTAWTPKTSSESS